MNEQNKGLEILNTIAARALADDDYRQQLLDDPAGVLQDAGIDVPAGVQVVVHENTSTVINLVLPAQAAEEVEIDVDETNLVKFIPMWGF